LKGRLFSRRGKGQPCARWLDIVVADLVVTAVRGWRGKEGQSRLEESCEGSQSPPRAVVLLLLLLLLMMMISILYMLL
jgi:hypothetical protein